MGQTIKIGVEPRFFLLIFDTISEINSEDAIFLKCPLFVETIIDQSVAFLYKYDWYWLQFWFLFRFSSVEVRVEAMVDIPGTTDEAADIVIFGVESEQIEEENDAYNDMRYELG